MTTTAHITIEQGATYNTPWICLGEDGLPVDLTGATAELKIKQGLFFDEAILTLSTESDPATLTVDDEGSITPSVDAETTAALDFSLARYDLMVTLADVTTKYYQGWARLSRTVTL